MIFVVVHEAVACDLLFLCALLLLLRSLFLLSVRVVACEGSLERSVAAAVQAPRRWSLWWRSFGRHPWRGEGLEVAKELQAVAIAGRARLTRRRSFGAAAMVVAPPPHHVASSLDPLMAVAAAVGAPMAGTQDPGGGGGMLPVTDSLRKKLGPAGVHHACWCCDFVMLQWRFRGIVVAFVLMLHEISCGCYAEQSFDIAAENFPPRRPWCSFVVVKAFL